MTTFSQMIDALVQETKRPGLRDSEIVSYLNQTIREVHFDPETNAVMLMNSNYNDEQVQADSESSAYWEIPNPATFQGMGAVRFDSVVGQDGNATYAQQVTPGRAAATKRYSYQVAGDRVFFRGYGGLNAYISLSWYEYPPALKYYAAGDRPAEYDSVTGWTYHDNYDDTDELKATARALTSNWLLLRWNMVLEEGLRAKIYKRLSDQARQTISYSLYQQQRRGLITSEVADYSGGYFSE